MDEMRTQSRQGVVTVGTEALAKRRRILRSDFGVIYEHYRRKVFFGVYASPGIPKTPKTLPRMLSFICSARSIPFEANRPSPHGCIA